MCEDWRSEDIEEWSTYTHIVQGNVFYAPHAHATAKDVGPVEDE